MKKHLYLLALGLVLVQGCGKKSDEAPLMLPGEYQTAATIATAEIRMYTKNGPVNNPQLVDKFINRRQLGTDYFSRTDVPLPSGGSIVLTINATNQATLVFTSPSTSAGSPPRITTVKAEVVQQTPRYFVLAAMDSSSYGVSNRPKNACETLAEQMSGVVAEKKCVNVPDFSGYSKSCMYRFSRVISINDGKLFIPQYSWQVQSGAAPGSTCSYAVGGSWNIFNPAILNQLAAGDTITVQERSVALIKK